AGRIGTGGAAVEPLLRPRTGRRSSRLSDVGIRTLLLRLLHAAGVVGRDCVLVPRGQGGIAGRRRRGTRRACTIPWRFTCQGGGRRCVLLGEVICTRHRFASGGGKRRRHE